METINQPRIGVGVCIIHDGKILLGKRNSYPGSGTWSMPGGHLEYKEKLEDCVKREVKEETNLDVGFSHVLTTTDDMFDEKHYLTVYAKADFKGGELKLMEPDRFEQWGWFKLEEVPEELFLQTRKILDFLQNELASDTIRELEKIT